MLLSKIINIREDLPYILNAVSFAKVFYSYKDEDDLDILIKLYLYASNDASISYDKTDLNFIMGIVKDSSFKTYMSKIKTYTLTKTFVKKLGHYLYLQTSIRDFNILINDPFSHLAITATTKELTTAKAVTILDNPNAGLLSFIYSQVITIDDEEDVKLIKELLEVYKTRVFRTIESIADLDTKLLNEIEHLIAKETIAPDFT